MLFFKDLLNKIYIKFTNSKFVKWLFPIFLLVLFPNVKASEMIFGANGSIRIHNGTTNYINVNQSSNNLPYSTGVSASGTTNWGVVDLVLSPASGNINVLDNSYNYLIFDICSGSNVNIVISNSSCGSSCVASGTYTPVSTGQSCTTGGYSGTRRLIQVRIQKWYLNEVAELLEASSYISISNTVSWYNPVTVNQVFLSDEDYTVAYANQEALINKLNSVQTAITNMQNSINSNVNTNTQNIINNQNSNTNAINGNIDQEFNDLKNYDHNYNNNASENINGGSDFNNFDSKQNQLKNNMNLDTSSIDVQFDSTGATFIWDIISSIRSIDPKITLLFTTLLSLGVIKFILNR